MSSPLVEKALRILQNQGARIIDTDLIKRTLKEIGKEYRPGLLAWIRTEYRRTRWQEMLTLEDRINKATLAGDEQGLRLAIEAYREFFREMTRLFEEAERLPLLFGRKESQK